MSRTSLLVAVIIVLLVSACTPLQPTKVAPVHLRVGTLHYLSFAPLFVAQQLGYFAEQGLDVEFVDFGTFDAPMIAALAQSQLDIGGMSLTAALLNAIADGTHIKLVADKGFANPNGCASAAMVASKSLLDAGALKDLAGLRGKSVAGSSANTFEWVVDLLLQKAGLTRSDVKVLNITDPLTLTAGLGSGSVNVTQLVEPWITRARNQGVGETWIPFSDLMPNASLAGIVYGPSILDKNHDAGVRFMTAYLKAIRQLEQGKTDANVALLADFTKLPADEIKEACWTSFQPDGKIDTQSLLDFQQWTIQKGYVARASDLSQMWDPQFADQADAILK